MDSFIFTNVFFYYCLTCSRSITLVLHFHELRFSWKYNKYVNFWMFLLFPGDDPLADVSDASDINSVGGVLKLYLRELREPLFPIFYFEQLVDISRKYAKNWFLLVYLQILFQLCGCERFALAINVLKEVCLSTFHNELVTEKPVIVFFFFRGWIQKRIHTQSEGSCQQSSKNCYCGFTLFICFLESVSILFVTRVKCHFISWEWNYNFLNFNNSFSTWQFFFLILNILYINVTIKSKLCFHFPLCSDFQQVVRTIFEKIEHSQFFKITNIFLYEKTILVTRFKAKSKLKT